MIIEPTFNVFSITALLCLLGFASYTDFQQRRIANGIVAHGIVLAITFALLFPSPGVAYTLLGLAIGGALLLPYYALGGMGAGDVKLMAMTGAFLGPQLVVPAVIMTLLAGAAIGVIYLCGQRAVNSPLGHRLLDPLSLKFVTHFDNVSKPQNKNKRKGIPYAPAIFIGTVVTLLWHTNVGVTLP